MHKHWLFIDEVFWHATCSMYGLSVLDLLPAICMALRCRTCHMQYVRPIDVGHVTCNMKCLSMSDMLRGICKASRCRTCHLQYVRFIGVPHCSGTMKKVTFTVPWGNIDPIFKKKKLNKSTVYYNFFFFPNNILQHRFVLTYRQIDTTLLRNFRI
jgi:hypothetical protein